MDNSQTLPLVPFGKYKGQPITNLLNDTKYLEWCKQKQTKNIREYFAKK